jgi:CheY-like chemotaxis protein
MEHILNEDMAFRSYAVGKVGAEQAAMAVDVGQLRGRPPAKTHDWNRYRALVVDDNANIRALFGTVLTGFGLGRVAAAASYDEARDFLSNQAFDAAVVDLDAEHSAVASFVGALRQSADPQTARLVVLGLGGGEAARKDPVLDGSLDKPVSPRELLVTLADLVESRPKE